MDYQLVVTTCGREGILERTLEAFDLLVRPRPYQGVIVDDSGNADYRRWLEALCQERGWSLATHTHQQGFCDTVADAWALAAEGEAPWVYWLEDDFVHLRPIDLLDLAHVLEREPQLAQMALLRGPVNDDEIRAGGLVQLRPEEYGIRGGGNVSWMEHSLYWTTNPSLFQRDLAREHPWPPPPHCEGVFGLELRAARPDVTFGLWGRGVDPWVAHVGARSGFGY